MHIDWVKLSIISLRYPYYRIVASLVHPQQQQLQQHEEGEVQSFGTFVLVSCTLWLRRFTWNFIRDSIAQHTYYILMTVI